MDTQPSLRWPSWRRNLKPRTDVALATFAAFLSYALGGCLSNEYVIPQAELARLAQMPPEQRGQRVQVVQEIGDRRGEAIDVNQPPPPAMAAQDQYYGPPPEGYVEEPPPPPVGVGVIIVPPPVVIGPPIPGPPLGPPLPGARGLLPPGPRGPMGVGPGRAPPVSPTRAGGPSARSFGKGGSSKEDVVAFIAVIAVLATVGMIATEGTRFDGYVAMYPWQPLYLVDENGGERQVPLAQITQADVATATKARVMDDEGWGLQRIERRPLDRRGFAFKLNLGVLHSSTAHLSADAFGANLQFGYFPHHRVGLLASWAISAGADANGDSFYRNDLAFEAQVFPLSLWRLHLGGFGHAGIQYADDAGLGTRNGAAFGGGAILELALTTRLALTFRADFTTARVGGTAWAGTQMYTAGVAIY